MQPCGPLLRAPLKCYSPSWLMFLPTMSKPTNNTPLREQGVCCPHSDCAMAGCVVFKVLQENLPLQLVKQSCTLQAVVAASCVACHKQADPEFSTVLCLCVLKAKLTTTSAFPPK